MLRTDLIKRINDFKAENGFTYGSLREFLEDNGCCMRWDYIKTGFIDVYDEITDEFLCKIKFSLGYDCCGEETDCVDYNRCESDREFFWGRRCDCDGRDISIDEIDSDDNSLTPDEDQLDSILSTKYYSMNELNEYMKFHGYDGENNVYEEVWESGYVDYRVKRHDPENVFKHGEYMIRVEYDVTDRCGEDIDDDLDRNELCNLDITRVRSRGYINTYLSY